MALEEFERIAAKGRQKEHGGTAPGKPKNTSGKFPEVIGSQSRDIVGKAAGISGRTYEKAKAVVLSGSQSLISEMDRTGKISETDWHPKPQRTCCSEQALDVMLIRQRGSDMAEKRPGKKAKSEPSPDRISIKIRPDPKPDTPSYYINYAAVTHSEYDFSVSVLRVPAQLTPEQTELAKKGSAVPVEPILQLIVPPRLVDGLIRAPEYPKGEV